MNDKENARRPARGYPHAREIPEPAHHGAFFDGFCGVSFSSLSPSSENQSRDTYKVCGLIEAR
jgi:hypothetical protein